MTLDVAALRRHFPSLQLEVDGRPFVYFDGPGGTQVPDGVIEAVGRYYRESNANHGGAFATSERSDAVVAAARQAAADFLGAPSPAAIHFGPNMTTLTFHVSRAIGAVLRPGDEILVTALDHNANIDPWRLVAAERGAVIRQVDVHPEDGTLDLDDLRGKLSARTRLVAVGFASNALGTVNPVAQIARWVHDAGGWVYVDAVHWAPHGLTDVVALDVDFLVCSAYKFYGPHQGVLYARPGLLESLPSYKVRPAEDPVETGTGAFELIAGVAAAVEYLAGIGGGLGDGPGASPAVDRRSQIRAAMAAIREYELGLFARLSRGLAEIPGLRLWGITDPARFAERAPTAAVTVSGHSPRELAAALGRRGIATWDGDFYARDLAERLGVAGSGGWLRIGLCHYNTAEEVDRLLAELEGLVA